MSTETGDPVGQADRTSVDFDAIEWENLESGSRIHRDRFVAVAVVGLYCLGWAYDHWYVSGDSFVPVVNPGNVDWLFGLTLLFMVFGMVVPLIRRPKMTRYYWRQFRRNKAAVISMVYLVGLFIVAVIGPTVVGSPSLDYTSGTDHPVPPVFLGGSWEYPLGTHRTGEDLLAITVSGARVSMQVGLIATMISITLATAFGATAAFMGGWVDEVLMRFVDLLLTFPTFFLILFLVYIYGGNLFLLIVILAFSGWGGAARLIRSEALQRTEEEYIQAARAAGASRTWIIRKHIIPNVSNTIITAATLAIPILILFEAVIAFLGFGDPNVWSWGQIIYDGQNQLRTAWWVSTLPGIFLFATVMAFNFVGDALRDALDPRHE